MKKLQQMKKVFLSILAAMILLATPVLAANLDVQVSSSEGSINFRSNASTSAPVIGQIPNGTALHVTNLTYSSGDNLIFGQTTYNGTTGWVSLRQTAISKFDGFDTKVSSTESSINFRSSATTGSGVIGQIPNGTALHISEMRYSEADDLFFGMTTYNGTTGWVSLRQTSLDTPAGAAPAQTQGAPAPAPAGATPAPANSGAANASPAPAASNPSELSIRTDVGFNGVVEVRAEEGSANFRTLPSTSSDVICTIRNHESLDIYDIVRNEDLVWGYTKYNGSFGWVSLRQTATPFHDYGMPADIRDWDGTIAGQAAAGTTDVGAANTGTADPNAANPGATDGVTINFGTASPNATDSTASPNAAAANTADDPWVTDTGAAATPTSADTDPTSAVYRYYNYNDAIGSYENSEYIMDQQGIYGYYFPEVRIRFTEYNVYGTTDYPHYAVIEHYDESGSVVWQITTDMIYGLNAGYVPLGASPDVFYYSNVENAFAVDIATGAPIWTVYTKDLGGTDGKYSGKAVGKDGEVYMCVRSSGKCMVINANGVIVYTDTANAYPGPNMVFSDISYTDNDMINVTTYDSESGKSAQFSFSRHALQPQP